MSRLFLMLLRRWCGRGRSGDRRRDSEALGLDVPAVSILSQFIGSALLCLEQAFESRQLSLQPSVADAQFDIVRGSMI